MENQPNTEFMNQNETWSCQDNCNGGQNCHKNKKLNSNQKQRRKSSFVWKYFRATANTKTLECIICNSCVSNQTSNLARHLLASHNITRVPLPNEAQNRYRTTRSYIWKYCTKKNARHARCNLCNKLLYFGSGSTSNIAKHLDRRHAHIVGSIKKQNRIVYTMDDDEDQKNEMLEQKKRKGSSYVWEYCEKLSRHTVRCKLCLKIMSFHGTANLITHLQRKHNVLGNSPVIPVTNISTDTYNHANDKSNDNSGMLINVSTGLLEDTRESLDNNNKDAVGSLSMRRIGRRYPGVSLVWKYCKRVGPDTVRCSICNKNLSNQGTSNLKRHLHRMHGIFMPGRVISAYNKSYNDEINDDFILQHCKLDDNDNYRCNMCTNIFPNDKEREEIIKHLLIMHSVKIKLGTSNYKTSRRHAKQKTYTETDSTEEVDDDYGDYNLNKGITNSNKNEESGPILTYDELNIKQDYEDYDHMVSANTDAEDKAFVPEKPIDEDTLPRINPLSPLSSHAASVESLDKREFHNFPESEKMQKLNEERVRMETEYYREKAGFYRMQKYLTALQAKKVRIELEQFYKQHTNKDVVVDNDTSISTTLSYNLGVQNKLV